MDKLKPLQDLTFVTDEHLYKEIMNYFSKEFPKIKELGEHVDFNEVSFSNNMMAGSGTYFTVATDMFCRKNLPDYRIAKLSDLESSLEMFKGVHIHTGLAMHELTSASRFEKFNEEQAKHLFVQLVQRGATPYSLPIWIDLRNLTLDRALHFNLTDESSYKFNADILNYNTGSGLSAAGFSKTDEFGLPIKACRGLISAILNKREIYTARHSPIEAVKLDHCSGICVGYSNFEDLYDKGRVVLTKIK
jgi:hypothetical protein